MKPIALTKSITLEQTQSIKSYLHDIKKYLPLSRTEELETIKLAQGGCEKSRQKVLNHNLRFVVSAAKRYQHGYSQILLVDLIQLGNMGLIKALDRFDVESGVKFITFAVWWIRKYIMAEMDEYNAPIKYPHNFYVSSAKIRALKIAFEQEHGYEPSATELQEFLTETDKRVLDFGELYTNRFVYLDREVLMANQGGEGVTALDYIEDPNTEATDHILQEEDQQLVLKRLLSGLNEREAAIVAASYGLGGADQESTENLAEKFGITPVRVRQIMAKAVKKMQQVASDLNYHPNNN
jgi:RNA polymerase primary sigma factor